MRKIRENHYNAYKDCFVSLEDCRSTLLYGDPEKIPIHAYSFVIPTYKRPGMLRLALESVLQQTAKIPFEVVVVDNDCDMGNDKTLAVIRDIADERVLYYRNEYNLGGAGNWNRGILLSRSNWSVFLHDDDLLMPDYLEKMNSLITDYPNIDQVGYIRAGSLSFYGDGLPDDKNQGQEQKGFMQRRFHNADKLIYSKRSGKDVYLNGGVAWFGAPTCGAVINRQAMLQVGGYDNAFSPCPDCFAGYKLMREYEILVTSPATGYYRWSQNDTYNLTTLVGLADRFEELLACLSMESKFVNFFKDCFYFDTIAWMHRKASEAGKSFDNSKCHNFNQYRKHPGRANMLRVIQRVDRLITVASMKQG